MILELESNSIAGSTREFLIGHGNTLSEIEEKYILFTLKKNRGNQSQTARDLGIGIRTIQRKIKQFRDNDKMPSYINTN